MDKPLQGVIIFSVQKGHEYFLIKSHDRKKQVAMTSATMFKSKALAHAAAVVLLALYNLGATRDDLKIVKESGRLFGVRRSQLKVS